MRRHPSSGHSKRGHRPHDNPAEEFEYPSEHTSNKENVPDNVDPPPNYDDSGGGPPIDTRTASRLGRPADEEVVVVSANDAEYKASNGQRATRVSAAAPSEQTADSTSASRGDLSG